MNLLERGEGRVGEERGWGGDMGREGGWGRAGDRGGREGEVEGGMTVIHILIGMFNSNPMIPQYYWNGQLVWTPALGLYL